MERVHAGACAGCCPGGPPSLLGSLPSAPAVSGSADAPHSSEALTSSCNKIISEVLGQGHLPSVLTTLTDFLGYAVPTSS